MWSAFLGKICFVLFLYHGWTNCNVFQQKKTFWNWWLWTVSWYKLQNPISKIWVSSSKTFSFSLLVFLLGQLLFNTSSALSTLSFFISVSSSHQWFPLSPICCDSALFNFLWWSKLFQKTIKNTTVNMFLWKASVELSFSRARYPVATVWKLKVWNDVFHSRSVVVFGIPAIMFLQFNSNLFPYLWTKRHRYVTN